MTREGMLRPALYEQALVLDGDNPIFHWSPAYLRRSSITLKALRASGGRATSPSTTPRFRSSGPLWRRSEGER